MTDIPSISTCAPVWALEWGPSERCWGCKQPIRGTCLDWSCELFPPESMCSSSCARTFIVHSSNICDAQRSQRLIDLTKHLGPDRMFESTPKPQWWRVSPFSDPKNTISCVFHHSKSHKTIVQTDQVEWKEATTQFKRADISTPHECMGCFSNFTSAPIFAIMDYDLRVHEHHGENQFCTLRCFRAWLQEQKMDPSLQLRVLNWTRAWAEIFYSTTAAFPDITLSDWRLLKCFGGPLTQDQLHNVPVRLMCLPRWGQKHGPRFSDVVWRTTDMVCCFHRGEVTTTASFRNWALSGLVEESLCKNTGSSVKRMEQDDKDDTSRGAWIPQTAPPHIRSILQQLPPDDFRSSFYCENADHPKAQKYVVFRVKEMPFATTSKSAESLRATLEDTTEIGSDEDDF